MLRRLRLLFADQRHCTNCLNVFGVYCMTCRHAIVAGICCRNCP